MRRLSSRSIVVSEALEVRCLLASSISGVVWNDTDFDSKHDALEKGIAGITVFADTNGNAKRDAGEASAVTGAGGAFRLSNVKNGQYPVRAIRGTTWNQSSPLQNYGHWVKIKSSSDSSVDFGLYPCDNTGAVLGRVYYDSDGDGIEDDDAPALAGRTVFVDYDNDKRMDTNEPWALSRADGMFQINHVKSGIANRAVRQILPEFWDQTAPISKTYPTTPPVGAAEWVSVTAGRYVFAMFGARPMQGAGGVVGRALLDEDGDGKFESLDNPYRNPSITGVGIWIDYDNDAKHDADEPCPVYTDIEHPGWGAALPNSAGVEDACYQIRNINVGRWPLRMSLMSGWKAVSTTVRWVTILPEQTVQVSDFLAQPTGSLGSITTSLFRDGNLDGKNNDGPGGIGVPVNGPVIFMDLDRVNNDYSMPEFNDPVQNLRYFSEMGDSTTVSIVDLPPGKYRLRCSLPYRGETAFWGNTTGSGMGIEVTVKAGQDTTVSPGFGLYLDTSFP